MKFLHPIDGDVLFSVADGVATEEGLRTKITLSAPAGSKILVNGQSARETDGKYTCEVLLDAYRNTVEAENADAAEAIIKAVTDAGYDYLIMDKDATRYGAVETRQEGWKYAKWLKSHEGEYDGIIMSLPNFSDENGAVAAVRDAGKPIFIQAYPDEIGKMDFAHRRDAYCGKFSVTDVFTQCKIPFTVMTPHVVHPLTKEFKSNLDDFAAICRVVGGMKRFSIGCIGARTTAFKTTRFDEIALQKYDITVESFDLSELVYKVQNRKVDAAVKAKIDRLKKYTNCSKVPQDRMEVLAKISCTIDDYIEEYHLDAISLRCWNEMETILRVCPCVLLSELNDRGIAASCEIDLCSAISMRAMSLAAEAPTAVLDWNNNYGDDENKVILFHCGSTAQKLMKETGTVTSHKMFDKGDPGSGWGTNEGRIAAFPMTFSNCKTEDGKITGTILDNNSNGIADRMEILREHYLDITIPTD